MENTFLERVLNNEYSENEIARVFADALDQTIYNMILKDFIERTGTDIAAIIARARMTLLSDFNETAKAKGVTINEDVLSKLERGLASGAAQTINNLS